MSLSLTTKRVRFRQVKISPRNLAKNQIFPQETVAAASPVKYASWWQEVGARLGLYLQQQLETQKKEAKCCSTEDPSEKQKTRNRKGKKCNATERGSRKRSERNWDGMVRKANPWCPFYSRGWIPRRRGPSLLL